MSDWDAICRIYGTATGNVTEIARTVLQRGRTRETMIAYSQCLCGHSEEEHRDDFRECETDDCECICFQSDTYEIEDL